MPSLISNPLIQFDISGATSEEPAPSRPAAEALAVETVAIPPTVPNTAMKILSNLLRIKGKFLSFRSKGDSSTVPPFAHPGER